MASNGVLYTWGCGENGQIGHNSGDNEVFPKVVDALTSAVVGQVSCGEHHTAVVTSVPYAKVAVDVLQWLALDKFEFEEKKKVFSQTRKPLMRKDLVYCIQKAKEHLQRADESKGDDLATTTDKKKMTMSATAAATATSPTAAKTMKGEPAPADESAPSTPAIKKPQVLESYDGASTRTLFHRETVQPLRTMISTIQEAVTQTSGDGGLDIQSVFAILCDRKKEHDRIHALSLAREEELTHLQNEIQSLQVTLEATTAGIEGTPMGAKQKELDMLANTVTIKIMESDQNRQMYDQNITHLKVCPIWDVSVCPRA